MDTTIRPRTSATPADMILEPVADIAPEQAADIIGIRSL
jgi:hypothetical protein